MALAIILLGATAPALASGSTCTSAEIAEPFVLPDGTEHAPGRLSLCVEGRHSPVAHRHTAHVDGMSMGLHIGNTDTSEGPATSGSYIMFGRGADGRLRLLGYARPGNEHMEVFSLRLVARNVDLHREAREPEGPLVSASLGF
jgi:hypothetical protein